MMVRLHCVSFDSQPTIHEIPSRHDLTAEEIDDCWYCTLEVEAMVAAAMDPAHECNLADSGKSRGLERYTSVIGSTRLETHRVQVVANVLREQQRQKSLFHKLVVNGEELLAAAAAEISKECQDLAFLQGYNDEVEVYAGDSAARNDVVDLPKPGLFSGLRNEVRAITDLAFLGRHGKPTKQQSAAKAAAAKTSAATYETTVSHWCHWWN